MKLIADEIKLKDDLHAKSVVHLLLEQFPEDDVLAYYKYPIYRGDMAEDIVQAEILLTSPKYGVIYIMFYNENDPQKLDKTYIDDLDSNIYKKFINRSELRKSRRELKFAITGLVVSNETYWDNDIQYVKFNDLVQYIKQQESTVLLSQEEYTILVSCIENTTKMTLKKHRNEVLDDKKVTKSRILNSIQQKETCFDYEQKKVALICIDSPQRIRGLAGSGKTILLTMKAALYHLSNPNAEILYTYYTKDLYDLIRKLIERFYRESADNHEPNWKKIHIYHAWGGTELEGVYSSTCASLNKVPITFQTARRNNPNHPFAYVCGTLLKEQIIPTYDLTLIDEGQDFPNEFFRLCYNLTKNRRIVWAYDEFQNIYDVKMQDEKETFGKDSDGNFLVDFNRDKIPYQDIILKCCYRNPKDILIGAFSLGMGIYYEQVLQRLESNLHWESLGFKVEQGSCKDDEKMIISRPPQNTPNTVNVQFKQDSLMLNIYQSFDEECSSVVDSIYADIHNEGLLADDICVICLDQRSISSYYNKISAMLIEKGIRSFNMLTAPNANRKFSYEGHVTLATLNKAKGNETGMVYIVGVHYIFTNPGNIINRNRLFTAITRAKGWVALSGVDDKYMELCNKELSRLKEHNMKLDFIQPSQIKTKTVMEGSLKQMSVLDGMKKQIEELIQLGLKKEDIINLLR